MSHSHLGDESITNISNGVLIESCDQETTIRNTTYDELTLLAIIGLIFKQQSPYPITFRVAHLDFTHTFDMKQIILNT